MMRLLGTSRVGCLLQLECRKVGVKQRHFPVLFRDWESADLIKLANLVLEKSLARLVKSRP